MVAEVGSAAPDFALSSDDDTIVRLSDFAGKPIVVYFYPKDDTSGCTKEAIAFNDLHAEFDTLGAEVLGISPDPVASHRRFKAKHDLELSLLADPDKTVCEAYGVWVEKKMYGRTYMGVERSTFLIGPDGKVAEAWRKVKVPGHAEAVLARTRELVNG